MNQVEVKARIASLTEELNRHNFLYYQKSTPEISDYEFDQKLKELEKLEEAHPDLKLTHSPTSRVGGGRHPAPGRSCPAPDRRTRRCHLGRTSARAAPRLRCAPIMPAAPRPRIPGRAASRHRPPIFDKGSSTKLDVHARPLLPKLTW